MNFHFTRLADREISITGKLACMSREVAIARIEEAGGAYIACPRKDTDFLVLGQGALPLGVDGRLTRSLRVARKLMGEGSGITIVPEEEFLTELGMEEHSEGLERLYSTDQMARLLGISARALRSWVRAELLRPARIAGRLYFFDFRQLARARTLLALSAQGVRPARIQRSLRELGGWWEDPTPNLSELAALESGGPLLVRLEDGSLAETSGQLRLDFDTAGEKRAALVSLPRNRESAEVWFERGIRAEECDRHEEAVEAYRRALEIEPDQPEVVFNLGNALYALNRKELAAEHFYRAADLDAFYVEAWNNLGNVLADLGRTQDSLRSFRRALAIEPSYADAHYNLAETLAAAGDQHGAVEHWRIFLRLDPDGTYSELVRERLAPFGNG